MEFAQLVTRDDQITNSGSAGLDAFKYAELRIDVAAVLATLPPDLLAIAEGLMEKNKSDVDRDFGILRITLAKQFLEIRQQFEKTAPKIYL